MSARFQHTLASPVTFEGVGLHTGAPARVTVRPAGADAGLCFLRTDIDGDNAIPARAELVTQTRLGTTLANAQGAAVATVEHLMAALCALAIDNASIEIDGPETPILDGCAAPYFHGLKAAGRARQSRPRRYIEVREAIHAENGDSRASLLPASRFELALEIDFEAAAVGRQRIELALEGDMFSEQLAASRTFGFLQDVDALRAAGLARGASLDNVLVIDGERVLNAEALRWPDECVRHKAVDAIGDLYLLGRPLIGRFEGLRSGHALNNALCRALLARPAAWRLIQLAEAPETAA